MEGHILHVTVLGRKITLKTDSDPANISHAITYIEQRAHELKRRSIVNDPHILSVLLNIVLADELIQSRQSNLPPSTTGRGVMIPEETTDRLLSMLEKNIED